MTCFSFFSDINVKLARESCGAGCGAQVTVVGEKHHGFFHGMGAGNDVFIRHPAEPWQLPDLPGVWSRDYARPSARRIRFANFFAVEENPIVDAEATHAIEESALARQIG